MAPLGEAEKAMLRAALKEADVDVVELTALMKRFFVFPRENFEGKLPYSSLQQAHPSSGGSSDPDSPCARHVARAARPSYPRENSC